MGELADSLVAWAGAGITELTTGIPCKDQEHRDAREIREELPHHASILLLDLWMGEAGEFALIGPAFGETVGGKMVEECISHRFGRPWSSLAGDFAQPHRAAQSVELAPVEIRA